MIKPVFSKHSGKKTGVLLVSILLSEIQDMIPVDTSEEEGMLITYEGKPLWDNEITITNITRQDVQTSDYSGMKFYYYYATEWLAGNLKMMLSILVITAFFGIIFFSIVEISERKMFACLLYTSGTSVNFFTLDKSLDREWDETVRQFLRGAGIACVEE